MGLKNLSRDERLRGKSAVQALFQQATTIVVPPLRVLVQVNPLPNSPHQVLFTVSKKFIPKATLRNRVKRMMREAYRLNKNKLEGLPALRIAYIYQSKNIPRLSEVAETMLQVFDKLKAYAEKI